MKKGRFFMKHPIEIIRQLTANEENVIWRQRCFLSAVIAQGM